MFWLFVHFVLYGPAGFRDETLAAYADRDATYHLVEMDQQAVLVGITVWFPEIWQLEARTPCFRHSAKITVPYPWFAVAGLRSQEQGCIQTEIEDRFLRQLTTMTLSEVQGGILILTSDDGSELVFRAQP